MKRIFLLWCLTAGAMWAYPSLNMTSAPTNANNGQSYYIEAQCWDSWGGVTVEVNSEVPCGACPNCVDRLQGLAALNG